MRFQRTACETKLVNDNGMKISSTKTLIEIIQRELKINGVIIRERINNSTSRYFLEQGTVKTQIFDEQDTFDHIDTMQDIIDLVVEIKNRLTEINAENKKQDFDINIII